MSGWELAWRWEPKGAVSGDHVDLLPPAGSSEGSQPLHLVLGDVAGKGIAASLLQSHLHALFRALIHENLPMGELMGRANSLFAAATSGASYATLIAARLWPDGSRRPDPAGDPSDRVGLRAPGPESHHRGPSCGPPQ